MRSTKSRDTEAYAEQVENTEISSHKDTKTQRKTTLCVAVTLWHIRSVPALRFFLVSTAILVTTITGFGQAPAGGNRPLFGYQIVRTYPHDPDAFTQGLEYVDGVFYEGTGLNGRSSIRKVKIETGEVLQKRDVPQEHFGEGITVWKSEIIELTWQSRIAFVYDRATFEPKRRFGYSGEGWGLTHDGTSLIMSDGSDALRVLDPATFAERRRIMVTAGGEPL